MTINNQDEREALIAAIAKGFQFKHPRQPMNRHRMENAADAILAANFHRNVGAVPSDDYVDETEWAADVALNQWLNGPIHYDGHKESPEKVVAWLRANSLQVVRVIRSTVPTSPPPSEVRVTGEQVEAAARAIYEASAHGDSEDMARAAFAAAGIPVAGEES